jgi:SAM-dependent methyltransferase
MTMDIQNVRGLKYPAEFVTRFFFKSAHHSRTGQVVELGCGDGNNLMLYQTYGWQVTGVDISAEALDNASHNLDGKGRFIQQNLAQGIPPGLDAPIDVLLLPYCLYYIPRSAFIRCLQQLAPKLAPDAEIFISLRTPDDYRYGRGAPSETNGFILNTSETGEGGLLNVFYFDHEIIDMLCNELGMVPDNLTILHCRFDNIQSGQLVFGNSDLIVWGKRDQIRT